MSRYIATRAIRGSNALVTEAELMLKKALAEKGPDTLVEFPNTAYFLPTIYAMTGVEALTLLEKKEFDVVLLDYKLPGMSGLLVMEEINKRYPHIKVLLITGAGSLEEEINQFIQSRAGEVLLKPIDIDELIKTVKQALNEK